ncbi:MAG TPA: 3-hydroxyacyl-CoA dehydrogenase NAD-binding domain-containing protein, partial [Candidatus Limnocylindrales bacterium]|nr:3-hydroxyacyl-CoA dehydrogenase NAD-binding domain-containing protein [Candidatus Limnocylindrales bacterium]
RGRESIRDGLMRRARKLDMDDESADEWAEGRLANLREATSLDEAAAGADVVIEAVVEDLQAKRTLLADLDAVSDPGTILATNTSALPVSAIAAAAVRHPGRVLGLHFFNPAPVLILVEVVAAKQTDPAVLERATGIVGAWGKTAVRSADSPGFIVNRVNRPFTIEALRMVETGEARAGEIDAAVRAGGFPMGPFELMDLVGLDVNLAAASAIWEGLGRPERLRPSPIQAWLVEHRRLGRKTGVGFYRYHVGHDPAIEPLPHAIARPVRVGRTLAPGVVVERIRAAIAAEAVLARDAGVASEADIDTALWLGAAHPEGPFAWLRRHHRAAGAGP